MIIGICNKCGIIFRRTTLIECGLVVEARKNLLPLESVWDKMRHEKKYPDHKVEIVE